MVNAQAVDFFLERDLTELPPAIKWQPRWEIRNRSDDFREIAWTAREMLHALMDENSLEGIGLVGIESGERQNSQAQSIEARFSPRHLQRRNIRRSIRIASDTANPVLVPFTRD